LTPLPVVFLYLHVAADVDSGWDLLPEVDEMRKVFKEGGVEACTRLLERKRDEWKNIPLNVAVIGNSGVGKSSFINAIRRLTADDDGAAPVDANECTAGIQNYSHPNNPKLQFWDLPGVGTDNFPRQTYLSDIGVVRFDFFLLITADRFTENDTWLGKEIHERTKKYFFVRTKIGLDVANDKVAHPRTHNEEAVVKVIRESTKKHLEKNNCKDVPMFLIDNHHPMKFEFGKLERHLVEDFPNLKKAALVMSLQATSTQMIQLKVQQLRSRMWKVAALSAAVAAVPLPGVSLAFDFYLVVEEAGVYFAQLGLDEASLRRYATLTSTNYDDLKAIVDGALGGFTVVGLKGIRKIVENILQRAAVPLATSTAIEEASRLLPLIGSFIASAASFSGTFYALKFTLDKMESTAIEVVNFAAKKSVYADKEESELVKTTRLKVQQLRSRMWKVAALSAVVAAVPVAGVSLVFDCGLVFEEADVYFTHLGLDEASLRRYANLTSTNYDDLKAIVDGAFGGVAMVSFEGFIENILKRAVVPLTTSTAIEEASKFFPVIGNFIIAPVASFSGTYYALQLTLDKMESTAIEVFSFAAKNSVDADKKKSA